MDYRYTIVTCSNRNTQCHGNTCPQAVIGNFHFNIARPRLVHGKFGGRRQIIGFIRSQISNLLGLSYVIIFTGIAEDLVMVIVAYENIFTLATVQDITVVARLYHTSQRSLGVNGVGNVHQGTGAAPENSICLKEKDAAHICHLIKGTGFENPCRLFGAVGLIHIAVKGKEQGAAHGNKLFRTHLNHQVVGICILSIRQRIGRCACYGNSSPGSAIGYPETEVILSCPLIIGVVAHGKNKIIAQSREIVDAARSNVAQSPDLNSARGSAIALPQGIAVSGIANKIEGIADSGQTVCIVFQNSNQLQFIAIDHPEHGIGLNKVINTIFVGVFRCCGKIVSSVNGGGNGGRGRNAGGLDLNCNNLVDYINNSNATRCIHDSQLHIIAVPNRTELHSRHGNSIITDLKGTRSRDICAAALCFGIAICRHINKGSVSSKVSSSL